MDVSNLFYPSMAEAEAVAPGDAKANKTISSASETGRIGYIEQMPEPIHGVHYKPFRPAFPISSYPGGSRAPEMFARFGEDKLLCSDAAGNTVVYNHNATAQGSFVGMPRRPTPPVGPKHVAVRRYDVLACYAVKSDSGYRAPDGNKAAVAVVGSGATICVSAAAATYALDTVAREWSKAGDWVLPFHGEAAHVPELGLWLGMSAGHSGSRHVCTVDISAPDMGSPPMAQHVGLDLVDTPEKAKTGP